MPDPILSYTLERQPQIVALIRGLVECESPSFDQAAVNRFVDLVSTRLSGLARVRAVKGGRFGNHLRARLILPGKKKSGQILVLGHSDTVWPLGTLAQMPFREAEGRLWGPGVFDMKCGIAFLIFAAQALRDLAIPVNREVVLLLSSDEEVGSESSRTLIESEARRSAAVLVLEPGAGLDGKAKTSRKGVGDYTVSVTGRSAHAGVDFTAGASAILELARQIDKIAGFTLLARGITVNPGVVSGGTRTNVVASEARAEIDVRVVRMKDAAPLDRKFRALKPFDKRCTVTVTGGVNRPPMERSAGVVKLLRIAQKLAAEVGVRLEESASGGGSDGNFTAALGIPTLDGLGGVGEGLHAPHESILVARIADRTALLAKLLQTL